MPAGEEHSKHAPLQDASAWKPIEVVTGEPSSIFDGSIPISDPWVLVDKGDKSLHDPRAKETLYLRSDMNPVLMVGVL